MSYGYPPQGIVVLPHELTHLVDGSDELDPFRIPIMIAR
ncbi:unnamed protein product, partial [marine sediment metagenome]